MNLFVFDLQTYLGQPMLYCDNGHHLVEEQIQQILKEGKLHKRQNLGMFRKILVEIQMMVNTTRKKNTYPYFFC
jgi:hypothetical protein